MASSATNMVLAVLVLSSCRAFSRSEEEVQRPPNCPPFHCGSLGNLGWPFSSNTSMPECGPLSVSGCNQSLQQIRLGPRSDKWFTLLGIYPNGTVHARDPVLEHNLHSSNPCQGFDDLSDPYTKPPWAPFRIYPTLKLLKCNHTSNCRAQFTDPFNYSCKGYSIYHNSSSKPFPPSDPRTCCMIIRLPVANKFVESSNDWFHSIVSDFFYEPHDCAGCIAGGGICRYKNEETFECVSQGKLKLRQKLGIGLGIVCPAAVGLLLCNIFGRYKQKKSASSALCTKSNSDSSSKIDFERDGAYFGVSILAYSELEEATNNFDSTKVLGDGGFGTVYYGQLRDGREVAVKRLYENSYRRVQQFMNEIKILTHLCHENLVTLHGCTSRHCRELLLVYEFIPNGTIADHLLRDKATLAWPVRLRIATETAKALTYLHASGIIHRDVKTSNILLDNHFSVKVADFGLSRLFPTDVTHVSTAPQGTPGYVDPEYHKCYQLTEKSDVYSFGVVLIQLITSLPAVDISREREEINLASFAVNKIQNGEFSDFLDPCLFLGSDMAGRRMVTLVAELAFQCLQSDRDHRPDMEEVLRFLKSIEGELYGAEVGEPVDDNTAMALKGNAKASLESKDGGVLLKGMHFPTSPISVSYMSCCSGSTASSSFTG